MADQPDWICCQLGAREHYAVARALHAQGCLAALITDSWAPPENALARLWPRLAQRYHPDLGGMAPYAWNIPAVGFEVWSGLRGRRDWDRIMARNAWFQHRALGALDEIERSLDRTGKPRARPTLFCYSYTALTLFRWAKRHGWRTMLGQIDGGLAEAKMIQALAATNATALAGRVAPERYWEMWREECQLADEIVVNSRWSRSLLEREGIGNGQLHVIPLAYTPPAESLRFTRRYPAQFTETRPLRVLFLGQVGFRKGALALLQAATQLRTDPVVVWMVGPDTKEVPRDLLRQPNVRWIGAVSRAQVAAYYQDADVFIFPTHSDGFGLTQLEAQAWKLPVIASKSCGEVVTQGTNGIVLPEVSEEAIISAVRGVVSNPKRLAEWASIGMDFSRYSLDAIGRQLVSLQ